MIRALRFATAALLVVSVSACVAGPGSSIASRSVAPIDPSAVPPEPSPSARSAATASDESVPPDWALDLPAQLECSGDPQQIGAVVGDSALLMNDSNTPEEALDLWIVDEADSYVALPMKGYAGIERTSHWALFGHLVEGRRKVAVLATDVEPAPMPGRWTVAAFAACDPAEFDPGNPLGYDIRIWSDAAGRVSTRQLLEMEDCYGGRRMRVDGRLFVRDPTGDAYDPAQLLTTFQASVELPASAKTTAFTEGDRRLYFAEDGTAAFIESLDGVERWPRVRGDEYLRMDCN